MGDIVQEFFFKPIIEFIKEKYPEYKDTETGLRMAISNNATSSSKLRKPRRCKDSKHVIQSRDMDVNKIKGHSNLYVCNGSNLVLMRKVIKLSHNKKLVPIKNYYPIGVLEEKAILPILQT